MSDFEPTHSPSVLVVEDEVRYRELLIRALPDMGFEGSGAGTGEEAVRQMKAKAHHIVVLDLNLPGMHGMELLEKLRDQWPDTRVVILTGFGDLDVAKQAIRLGVDDFLTKPCHLGELEKALDRARKNWEPKLPTLGGGGGDDGAVDGTEKGPAAEAASPGGPGAEAGRAQLTDEQIEQTEAAATLRDIERQHILAALERHKGNREVTAKELGISVRKLYYRLAEYQQQGYLQGD